jgi:hypothetical protein
MDGICKFFLERRYGFISIQDESGRELADFFFSASDVIDSPPRRGDGVTFWLDRDPHRHNLVAVEVRAL